MSRTDGRVPAPLRCHRCPGAPYNSRFMFLRVLNRFCKLCVGTLLLGAPVAGALSGASWNGTLSDGSGKPVAAAVVKLHSAAGGRDYTATTAPNGRFTFAEIAKGGYEVSVKLADKEWKAGPPLLVKDRDLTMALETSPVGQELASPPPPERHRRRLAAASIFPALKFPVCR
jgi:Carboxypeptidase regulatory-like domain